jgi:plastocyanin
LTEAKQPLLAALRSCVIFLFLGTPSYSQETTVSAQVELVSQNAGERPSSAGTAAKNEQDVIVWLKPLDRKAVIDAAAHATSKRPALVQKDKNFAPHLLVVEVGSFVDFPNRDPFFHNVFSLFDGKRFDLGLYEAGATNSVRFDRVGVSFLFCNIHPQMSAVVVAVDTPYYGKTDRSGHLTISGVPYGRYEMHVWYERSLPEELKALTRAVTVSGATFNLGTLRIPENQNFTPAHKNKYGQDYAPPPANSYEHP